jgi:hypothetical protein
LYYFKKKWKKLLYIAIFWIVVMYIFSKLFDLPFLLKLARSISPEGWVGLGATIVSGVVAYIIDREKERQSSNIDRYDANRELIRELENGLDSIISRLNAIHELQEEIGKLKEAIVAVKENMAVISAKQESNGQVMLVLTLLLNLNNDVVLLKTLLNVNSSRNQSGADENLK